MENELNKLADMLILNEIKLPITLEATQNPILFDLLNQSLSKRKNLLFPNFNNSKTVCIFRTMVVNLQTVNIIHIHFCL